MSLAEHARAAFRRRYGREPRLFRAPGRVNLIGEHTDYNDGFVLPIAIERETLVASSPRADRTLRVHSTALSISGEIELGAPPCKRRGTFLDYVEGMARSLPDPGAGADLLVDSDVPPGGGLSSSAALELAVGLALLDRWGTSLDLERIALAGQRAEHEYVGTRCGIMDQLVVALAEADHALLIDCRTLARRAIPLGGGAVVVVCDTRSKHDLASSAYNDRRAECERAVAALAERLPSVRALRDVSRDELAAHAGALDAVAARRARHVVTENERTLEAADALAASDYARFGTLMLESHESLRVDYEVSTPELDALVRAVVGQPGVFGARLTGGGFGGCTITLVRPERADAVSEILRRTLHDEFARTAGVFTTRAARGAGPL